MKLIALLITLALVLRRTYGYYIPQNESKHVKNDWNIFKQKLGLSADKVELLKSQKNQQYTMNLVNRFIEENPKYVAIHEKSENQEKKIDNFSNFYRSLVKNLPSSKHTLKTSLNFELNDDDKKSGEDLKRSRRKIAVRMVSDMPVERIDELLTLFNRKHGIEDTNLRGSEEVSETNDATDYDSTIEQTSASLSSTSDADYLYENLYEDDQDASDYLKTYNNLEFKSLQDLILQANKGQWK